MVDITEKSLYDPNMIQWFMYDLLEEKIGNGAKIGDVHNTYSAVTEGVSMLGAKIVNLFQNEYERDRINRQQDPESLYRALADRDTTGLFATPVGTEFALAMDKTEIERLAFDTDTTYKKVVIPRNTIFTYAGFEFGIFYPIEIRFNKTTSTPVVVYDTSEPNKMHPLTSNVVPFTTYTKSRIDVLNMKFPVFQISRVGIHEVVDAPSGYMSDHNYDGYFCNIRAWHKINGVWTELTTCLSTKTIDPSKPTLVFVPDQNRKVVRTVIPQIYFSNNMIGTELRIEVITTRGEVSFVTTSEDLIEMNVPPNESGDYPPYTIPHGALKIFELKPVHNTVRGGSFGITFDQLVRRVKDHDDNDGAIVAPSAIENRMASRGLSVRRYNDSLKELVWLAERDIEVQSGDVIPCTKIDAEIDVEQCATVPSIEIFGLTGLTIFPGTIFKFNGSTNTAVPLSQAELDQLNGLNKVDLVNHLNSKTYLRSPYHVYLGMQNRTFAQSYDFNTPTIEQVQHVLENTSVGSQISILGVTAEHVAGTTSDTFTITLHVSKTGAIEELDETDIKIVLSTQGANFNRVFAVATHVSDSSAFSTYQCVFSTKGFRGYGNIACTGFSDTNGVAYDTIIPIEPVFDVITMVSSDVFDSGATVIRPDQMLDYVPNTFKAKIPLIHQKVHMKLGISLDELVFNKVDVIRSKVEYERYGVDIPATYDRDDWERDDDDNPVYEISNGKVLLNKVQTAGDVVTVNGEVQHQIKATDLKKIGGKPIPVGGGSRKIYRVEMIFVDEQWMRSENPVHSRLLGEFSDVMKAYFADIESQKDALIPGTELFFQPIRTIGVARFRQSTITTLIHDLAIQPAIRLYVFEHIYKSDEKKEEVKLVATSIIDKHVRSGDINLARMIDEIRTTIPDMVINGDVLGINGSSDIQTLQVDSPGARPRIRTELYISESNGIDIRKDVVIKIAAQKGTTA